MFGMSESDEDSPQHSGGFNDSHNGRMEQIAQARRAEMRETYDEEMESFSRKRRYSDGKGETLSDSDSGDEAQQEPRQPEAKKMTVAEAMMAKMGHRKGEGLGKAGQGRVEPVGLSTQRGRVGLGHGATKAVGRDLSETWDESVEDKTHEETVTWLEQCPEDVREEAALECESDGWMELGQTKKTLDDETEYCDPQILVDMLKAKDVFDHLSDRELREARTRANPYETVGGAFFQNRAAMKAANMDKVFDWIFSLEDPETLAKKNPVNVNDKGINTDRNKPLFYFADVCAGPGGFSEYMLWRKGYYNTKGFGFTLAGKDDFKLDKFTASSPHFFEAFYGKYGDGDVMNPENIDTLQEFIMKGTNGEGVHLMMADGGFSVEGQENIQEILSKRLYLCQLLVSLCIVREGGSFFCKLFDIFTPFSAGLIYLMYVCYDQISLHKPHTSRPANSERYIICRGLRRNYSDRIRGYLKRVNVKLDQLKKEGKSEKEDVVACVPSDVMRNDGEFMRYLIRHNERMAIRQTTYLRKYLSFAKNQGLIDKDQGDIRDKCLEYWQVPNKQRTRDADINRQNLNPLGILGSFATKLFGDNDLILRIPQFTAEIFANPGDKQLKYAEWTCSILTERTQPKLLVSSGKTAWVYDREWKRFDNTEMRIPDKTVLFVELSDVYHYEHNRLTEDSKIVRIIDAAVLHGDDVSKLSYANRLQAAEKFCLALDRVNSVFEMRVRPRDPPRKFSPRQLVVTKLFSPEKLSSLKNSFKLVRHKGTELLTFEEDGRTLTCYGVRFARILKSDYKMGWSRSANLVYAFKPGRSSIFEKDFESHDLCASFWDVCLMKKTGRPVDIQTANQCIWKWENSLSDNYGPRVIVEDDSHKSGPTLKSIETIIWDTEQRAGKAFH